MQLRRESIAIKIAKTTTFMEADMPELDLQHQSGYKYVVFKRNRAMSHVELLFSLLGIKLNSYLAAITESTHNYKRSWYCSDNRQVTQMRALLAAFRRIAVDYIDF